MSITSGDARVIDARSRFTKAPARSETCRECGAPGSVIVLPNIDHRRRKPWPTQYWLCDEHADSVR
ncbi:Uncharacterised protein [Mycobacteroides abscessus subsp. massiliense]|nr:Uncharacterised protein [Mycobacteroides abscessus subsp. massiliense]SKF43666.1 Uncharacterised protein [Mycobacteroides abscessus subsp. massiliense]SKF45496.1 Uncharacterised protein [Mycobacteroides abscessus subsp. massiliense]SKF48317.1 Uncharacterised protein [Mycobacteroides abscessus subsp. massiliense]SKF50097.1 Uncharacterised protein [Mycobacteroides abscessus subsp. massiliense]